MAGHVVVYAPLRPLHPLQHILIRPSPVYFTPTTAGPQHLVWLLLCKLSQDGLSARLSGLCEKPLTSFFFGVRDTDTLNVG